MTKPLLSALLVSSTLIGVGQSYLRHPAENWKSIVPLLSSRSDVERQLGLSDSQDCSECTYRTPTETAFVIYSRAPCQATTANGWNVPKGTVVRLTIFPRETSAEKIDRAKFAAEKVVHISSGYVVLQESGISYAFDADDRIKSVSYLPKEADNNRRCRGYPLYNPAGSLYTPATAFSEEDGIINLSVLAAESKVQPAESIIFVVVYAGRKMSAARYKEVLDRYRNTLYEKLKVAPTKIKLVKGGRRERFAGHVFYLKAGDPPPTPSPEYADRE
jgi:hypothetical protein